MRPRSTNAQRRGPSRGIGGLPGLLSVALSLASPACEGGWPLGADEQPRELRDDARPPAKDPGQPEAGDEPEPAAETGTPDIEALAPPDLHRDPVSGRRTPVPAPSPGAGIEDERNTIAVFEAMAPATVFVTQTQLVRNRFTMRVDQIPAGTGTGFIWDDEGHVVTNFHVVAGGHSLAVTLWDGTSVPAKFVGGDPKRDIAVLALDLEALREQSQKIDDAHGLTPVSLPPEEQPLVVGQKALAIGNPFGLDHTLTVGVISALGREVLGYGGVTIRDMIQTDASINPGNSGGPLLDSAGQLIGMNTMIYSKSGVSAGIGFAVPVATIRRLVPEILEYGAPRRAALGVEIVNDLAARRAGIRGVVIERVDPEGPAATAGLRGLSRKAGQLVLGDVIVGIDEHEIASYDDLFNALEHYEPGDSVEVKVTRAGEVFAIEVELALL